MLSFYVTEVETIHWVKAMFPNACCNWFRPTVWICKIHRSAKYYAQGCQYLIECFTGAFLKCFIIVLLKYFTCGIPWNNGEWMHGNRERNTSQVSTMTLHFYVGFMIVFLHSFCFSSCLPVPVWSEFLSWLSSMYCDWGYVNQIKPFFLTLILVTMFRHNYRKLRQASRFWLTSMMNYS